MKCEWVQENILLYIYNELADDARYELEQHLGRCTDCASELKGARGFHATISNLLVQEPTPNLLASSRMRLQEALETTQPGGFWQRLTFDPAHWLRQVRFSPALAAVIFIMGFAGGIGAMYKMIRANPGPIASQVTPTVPSIPQEASITGIRSVTQEPGSDQVNIKYDTVHMEEAQGSLNDQKIQQLLLFAARNNYSSGVRMDSVDLLTQKPDDTRVREALIYALRNDSNPGVRLKAIEGLGSFVKDDVRVRDAVVNALMTDNNPGVRTQALLLLQPVKADSSVRAALQHLAETDQNQYIRSQARTVLAQLPEID
ncbi:MAG TPA: HEAT repeat domain-containing protein [Terriglobales bacterium]|nr:HEAT repeat domain-containing protein [Terriglobales bacterium]